MIFLVLVCVATAVLLAWLAVELGRIALGEQGYARVPTLLHGVVGAVVKVPGELRDVRRGHRPAARPKPVPPAASAGPNPTQSSDIWAEPWEVDEAVERMVRERLYGVGKDARRRVDAA